MKISKRKLRIITTILLIMLVIVLIVMCFGMNSGTLVNSIIGKNSIYQQQENDVAIVDTSKWDLEKVNIVYDTNNVPVPVPKGYVASGINGEHTVNTGFVIYEGEEPVTGLPNEVVGTYSTDPNSAWVASCTRNQWVWIPVPDSSRIYERDSITGRAKSKLYIFSLNKITSRSNEDYEPSMLKDSRYGDLERVLIESSIQGISKEKLAEEMQIEFEETIKSIEKYGGFYIGRYETGNFSSADKRLVIKRMNTDLSIKTTWYDMYNNIKNIQENENVKSNMIWMCLWHETARWLIESGNKTIEQIFNAESWGNYRNTTFIYIDESGNKITKTSSKLIPTGSTEYTKANNIYDMAGNQAEWTFTHSSSDRVVQGGDYYYDDGRAFTGFSATDHTYPTSINARAYFYIK